MNPDLVDQLGAIVSVIATSRDGLTVGAVALLSIVENITILFRGGTVHDIAEAKSALLDGMRARVEERRANVLVKNAEAFKKVAEAVQITNGNLREPADERKSQQPNMEAASARLNDALLILGGMGGRLMIDPENLDRVRQMLHGRIDNTIEVSPLPAMETAINPMVELEASGIAGSSSSAGPMGEDSAEPNLEEPL